MSSRRDHDRPTRRVITVVICLVALVALAVPYWLVRGALESDASFADTEVFQTNRLGAATVDLELGQGSAELGARNLAPGDVIAGQVTLANVGTLPIRVGVSAGTDGGLLAGWMTFEFWTSDTTCSLAGAPSPARNFVIPATPTTVLGAQRADGTDTRVAVDAGATALLCVQAALPLVAPNEVQSTELRLDLRFDAEHDVEATR